MATRSPYNDRYKVDQKGKTRKSASASKPKRAVADLTSSGAPAKKAAPKRKWYSPAPASQQQAIVTTPEMQKLRRIWWVLWILSLAIAFGILLLQKLGDATTPTLVLLGLQLKTDPAYLGTVPFLWGLWAACMGGAFYLEFVPIRKARAVGIELARHGGKPAKSEAAAKLTERPAKKSASPKKAAVPTADDTSESSEK